MAYHAKVLAHSEGPDGQELFTVEARFPRIVLAEVVTHRTCRDEFGPFELTSGERTTTEDISKNSASSRAIPLARMIQAVVEDPFIPERFSAAGKGMQGAGWLEGADHEAAVRRWLRARDHAAEEAMLMVTAADREAMLDTLPRDGATWNFVADAHAGAPFPGPSVSVHKQDVNRLLEPFAWVTQVLTADRGGWSNFFALRCDAAAHPAFQRVARMIYLRYRASPPELLGHGEWHLPFVPRGQRAGFRYAPGTGATKIPPAAVPDPIQFSAARCAWVSYENHDRDGTSEQMRATFRRLVGARPLHASPVEHQGTPWPAAAFLPDEWRSNLRGWVQARKLLAGERTDEYRPSDEEVASWGLALD
jgi:hypothetical protein